MTTPGQATDKATTPATEAADQQRARVFRVVYPDGYVLHGVQFPSGRCILDDTLTGLVEAATAIEHLKLPGKYGVIEWEPDHAAGVHAGRDQVIAEMRTECTSTLMDLAINPDHHGCPCRTTGRHRVHRCMHGTEWWSAVPDSHNTQEDA